MSDDGAGRPDPEGRPDGDLTHEEAPEPARCSYCGLELEPGYGIVLDVQRPDAPGTDETNRVTVSFCTQRHAARWLEGDAPPSVVRLPHREPLSTGDRLLAGLVVVAVALLVGLTLVGAWTVGGWIF